MKNVENHLLPFKAARFIVLIIGLICVALAGILFLLVGAHYPIFLGVLAITGVLYLCVFAFGSDARCERIVRLMILGRSRNERNDS